MSELGHLLPNSYRRRTSALPPRTFSQARFFPNGQTSIALAVFLFFATMPFRTPNTGKAMARAIGMLALYWFSLLTPASATGGETEPGSLEDLCKTVYCRHIDTIQIKLSNGSIAEYQIGNPVPVFDGKYLIIFVGETVYLEAEERDGSIGNFRAVPDLVHPDRTMTFKLYQTDFGMMLSVNNPFSKLIKFHADMAVPERQGFYKTSTCPVFSGSFESWPHPIIQLLVHDFRILDQDDPKAGSCEY